MARVVAEKGYAASTIADVVREAGVSRRTFWLYGVLALLGVALVKAKWRANWTSGARI